MTEEWRSIPGYEDYYEVSDCGRIRAVTRRIPHARNGTVVRSGRIRRLTIDTYGYPQVSLSKLDDYRPMKVHRAVALAFLGPPPPSRPHVNHRDGNKLNSRPENLEWCSAKENAAHAIAIGLVTKRVGLQCGAVAKLAPSQVLEIRALASAGMARTVIASKFGISAKYIWEIVARKTWSHL